MTRGFGIRFNFDEEFHGDFGLLTMGVLEFAVYGFINIFNCKWNFMCSGYRVTRFIHIYVINIFRLTDIFL